MNSEIKVDRQDWLSDAMSAEAGAKPYNAEHPHILSARLQQRRQEKARQQSRTWLIEAMQVTEGEEAFDQLFSTTFPSKH